MDKGKRPANRVFKLVHWRGIMFGARLAVPGPGAPDHTEVIRRGQPRRAAQNGPESIWGEDGPGAQMRSVDCGVAGLRNACHRSGSSSSIRRAGWVLIRSSTSRR